MKTFKLYLPAYIIIILFGLLTVIGVRETHARKQEVVPETIKYKYNIEEKNSYNEMISDTIQMINISKFTINDIDLKEYIKNTNIEAILNDFEEEKIYSNYILYKKEDDTNKVIKIIRCVNKTYIIGNEYLTYEKNMCK